MLHSIITVYSPFRKSPVESRTHIEKVEDWKVAPPAARERSTRAHVTWRFFRGFCLLIDFTSTLAHG
jgi:hypothetical protein